MVRALLVALIGTSLLGFAGYNWAKALKHRPSQASLNQELMSASYSGDIVAANSAIAHGADVNFRSGEWTPLMYAASLGHTRVIETLLNSGAAILARNTGGQTALDLARQFNRTNAVDTLTRLQWRSFAGFQLGATLSSSTRNRLWAHCSPQQSQVSDTPGIQNFECRGVGTAIENLRLVFFNDRLFLINAQFKNESGSIGNRTAMESLKNQFGRFPEEKNSVFSLETGVPQKVLVACAKTPLSCFQEAADKAGARFENYFYTNSKNSAQSLSIKLIDLPTLDRFKLARAAHKTKQ